MNVKADWHKWMSDWKTSISDWKAFVRKSIPVALMAIFVVVMSLVMWGQGNTKHMEFQELIGWSYVGPAGMEQTKQELEADRLELAEATNQLQQLQSSTQQLLAQLNTLHSDTKALLEKAEQEEGVVADKIGELIDAYEKLEQQEQQRWVMPIQYTLCTSRYGYRQHPIDGEAKFHSGVDLAAPAGTPIVASRSGTVKKADYVADNEGYYVVIDHMDGFVTQYLHMSKFIVQEGQFVFAGQVIGYCGSTGASTGPHLHFSVYLNNKTVNPADYLDI